MQVSLALPTPLVDAIRTDPNLAHHWMNLSMWLGFHGRDDEAVAVRALWETLRDNVASTSLEATLENLTRNARLLAVIARAIEKRASESTVVG